MDVYRSRWVVVTVLALPARVALLLGEELDALVGLEVVLHPETGSFVGV